MHDLLATSIQCANTECNDLELQSVLSCVCVHHDLVHVTLESILACNALPESPRGWMFLSQVTTLGLATVLDRCKA